MEAIPLIFSIAQTGFSVFSALSQASIDSANAKREADIAEYNRRESINVGNINAQEADIEAGQEIGAYTSIVGSSGLLVGQGSIQARQKALKELAAKDRELIVSDAQHTSYNYANQAAAARAEAKNAKTSGYINAGASLISGASKTYSAYTSYRDRNKSVKVRIVR